MSETEGTTVGWLPSLGGWRKNEGASRKDILSGLVRLWPVLFYMSHVSPLTQVHISHSLTSRFLSDRPLCLTNNPTKAETEICTDTYFSSSWTVASYKEIQNKDQDLEFVLHSWISHNLIWSFFIFFWWLHYRMLTSKILGLVGFFSRVFLQSLNGPCIIIVLAFTYGIVNLEFFWKH